MGVRAPLIASLALLAGMALVSVWAWPTIPNGAHLAVHFDIAGRPNGFAPKAFALLCMPLSGLAATLVFAAIGSRPSAVGHPVSDMPAFAAGWIGTLLLLAFAHIGIVMLARGVLIDVTRNVFFFIGLLFAVLGNFLGKTERNNFVGVRTAWTLSSDYSWQKTNRAGGWMMVGIGLADLAALACAGPKLAQTVLIGGTVLLLAVAIPLSRHYWKQDPERRIDSGRG